MSRSISTEIELISYYNYHKNYPTAYLFGSESTLSQEYFHSSQVFYQNKYSLFYKTNNSTLIIRPFRMEKFGQVYINPQELLIDFQKIKNGTYKIIVVHNFQVEDRNPNLRECLAGIFLASQIDGKWEEPENYPIECRTIDTLVYVYAENGQVFYL